MVPLQLTIPKYNSQKKKKKGLPPPFPQTIVKCYFSDFHPERREQSEGHLPEHTGNTMGITMQKLGHPISPT